MSYRHGVRIWSWLGILAVALVPACGGGGGDDD